MDFSLWHRRSENREPESAEEEEEEILGSDDDEQVRMLCITP